MLECHLQSAGGQAGDFFAGEILSVRLKKQKRPVLAHFFSTVHQKVIRRFFKLFGAKKLSLLS
jgi:hypothetical protein